MPKVYELGLTFFEALKTSTLHQGLQIASAFGYSRRKAEMVLYQTPEPKTLDYSLCDRNLLVILSKKILLNCPS